MAKPARKTMKKTVSPIAALAAILIVVAIVVFVYVKFGKAKLEPASGPEVEKIQSKITAHFEEMKARNPNFGRGRMRQLQSIRGGASFGAQEPTKKGQ